MYVHHVEMVISWMVGNVKHVMRLIVLHALNTLMNVSDIRFQLDKLRLKTI